MLIHRLIATLSADVAATSVTLMSPGKMFNTAGLNMGFAGIPDSERRARYQAACKSVPNDSRRSTTTPGVLAPI